MKISIITPNYNYSQFIGETIESVIEQGYQNFEHVIVDDGSTDNSIDVIKKYCEKYPEKIKLISQKNQGQSSALNKALENCTGDIICWLNSDDKFAKSAFIKVVEIFTANNKIDAIFGDIIIINENNQELKKVKYLPFNYLSGIFNGFGKIIPSNAIFWKRALSSSENHFEGFNLNLHYAMDSEYWSRILLNKNVIHIDEYLAFFRYHSSAKTIKRLVKNSKESIDSNCEDNFVKEKSLKGRKLNNNLINSLLFYYFKLSRHFFKLILGHYFN